MSREVVVGIGMSSRATVGEVQDVIDEVLSDASLSRADVVSVATRDRFGADERLPVGVAVDLVTDAELIAASEPTDRTLGIPARVAVTAAAVAATRRWGGARVVVPTRRSPHVTVAVCEGVTP